MARNEAGIPVQANNLGTLHRVALDAGRRDLAAVFRESLKSVTGRAALRAETDMIVDLLEDQVRIWVEHSRGLKKSLRGATGENKRELLLNIPEAEERIKDLQGAIRWHRKRHKTAATKA